MRALRYRDLAAREAARVAGYSRAMHHLERALALAPADSVTLADLQLRLADAAMRASDFARERRAALAATELCASLGDQLGLGTALLSLSRNRFLTGDVVEAAELQGRAVRILEPLGDSDALARAYADIAWRANGVLRRDRVDLAIAPSSSRAGRTPPALGLGAAKPR